MVKELSLVDRLLIHPVTGALAALAVLMAIYYFVGVFGAGDVVDFLEGLYEEKVTPLLVALFSTVPEPLRSLFVGEYGILTLAIRYSFAVILPIVAFFFLAYAIIEDTGYLPRLAAFLDNVLRRLGLSGRAIIPLFLGLGCVTMATVATRVLSSTRERIIAALMLALAVPCSAQQGVVFAILPSVWALLVWAFVISAAMLLIAGVANKIMGGRAPPLAIELPPWRTPTVRGVAFKVFTKLKWYLVEVVPIFIVASVIIWVLELIGVLAPILAAFSVPARMMGLPSDAANAFLYGFFRRDYGAAGLFDIREMLGPAEATAAAITITLFVPCIANFLVLVRQFSVRFALLVYTLNLSIAFSVGITVYNVLKLVGW
jgi:ferrous iron transport protein B